MLNGSFVIPGGRFRELYYWDTYWIVSGLLLCDMTTTARGVIENLIYLLRTYNIIPNGSRKYYLQRSQPPLLIPMVEQYYQHTKDLEFVKQNIEVCNVVLYANFYKYETTSKCLYIFDVLFMVVRCWSMYRQIVAYFPVTVGVVMVWRNEHHVFVVLEYTCNGGSVSRLRSSSVSISHSVQSWPL